MIEIAKIYPDNQGIYQKEIAKNQSLPIKYLDHIIHALKVAGLIRRSGKRGGYVLTKKPEDITMHDIYNAFESNLCIVECLEKDILCEREKICESREFWSGLNTLITDYCQSVNIQDLLDRLPPKE